MDRSDLIKRLTHTPKNMQDLKTHAPDWMPAVEAVLATSDDLRSIVEHVFPGQHAFHLIQAPSPRRQIWWAALSGFDVANIPCPNTLRLNLLMLSDDALLKARFGDNAVALKPLLQALSPKPLFGSQYDVLAALVHEIADDLQAWIARDGNLDTYRLREHLFPDVDTMKAVLSEEGGN